MTRPTIRLGDRGEDVKHLQRILGVAADGIFGPGTRDALIRYQKANGLTADGIAGPSTWQAIDAIWDAPPNPPPGLVDLRPMASTQDVGGRRSWKQITGIVLHQTACTLGERARRWYTLGAHVGVTRGGQVFWVHDLRTIVWHANGFNGSTVGIEMDGEYAGVEGNDRTFWRPKTEPNRQPQIPTPELIEAAKAAVRWIVADVARHGGQVTRLLAHRQASADRQSDPGSRLWQDVGLAMIAEIGLSDGGPGYKVGDGLPIPGEWDPSRSTYRY